MAFDALFGLGIVVHIPHLPRLAGEINVSIKSSMMEVSMHIKGAWELVAQRIQVGWVNMRKQ